MGIYQLRFFNPNISLNPEMSVIIILLSASITIAIGFLIAFVWSVKNGQYDDDYTPSVRILFDDEIIKETADETIKQKKLQT